MKKLTVLFVGLLVCLVGKCGPDYSYIAYNQGKITCKKIHMGILNAHIIKESGEKITLSKDQLLSYTLKGKTFEKIALNPSNTVTSKRVFMELIKETDGYKLYRYSHYKWVGSDTRWVDGFYFYTGDKLIGELNEQNIPRVLKQFGFKAILVDNEQMPIKSNL